MTKAHYRFYSLLRRALPASVQESLGGSRLTEPLRRYLLRPDGQSRMEVGEIAWEDLRFTFCAPFRTFHNARERGVENTLCRLARSVLRPGDTAVDVGANYGFVTMVMAHSVQPGGRVFSFEINPTVAATLAETIAANEMEPVVRLTPKGAGSRAGHGLVTVDEVVAPAAGSPVRFLKIDTDGADYGVLQGAVGVLERHHPTVVIEMHENARAIHELLRACGYSCFAGIDGRALVPGEWPANLIASTSPIVIPAKGAFVH